MTNSGNYPPVGKRLGREQIDNLISSPEVQAENARNQQIALSRELYAKSAAGLLADLAAAGFVVESVGQLRRERRNYKPVVPVLLKWLPRVRYLWLADDIVRSLSASFARGQAVPVFLQMFRNPPEVYDPMRPKNSPKREQEDLRWVIGNGLGIHANPSIADELIELAQDRRYGEARNQIVLALPKTKDDRVPEVLLELLDDSTVAPHAIEALGKMRHAAAAVPIERMLDSPDENVRYQAKKALRRLRG